MYICNCLGLTKAQLDEQSDKYDHLIPLLTQGFGLDLKEDNYCGKCFRELIDIALKDK